MVLATPITVPAERSRRRSPAGVAGENVPVRSGTRPEAVVGLAVAQLIIIALGLPVLLASPRLSAASAALVAVMNIALLMRLRGNRQVSLGSVFLLIYAVFHVGLTPYLIFNTRPKLLTQATGDPLTWLLSPQISAALVLVVVSMSAYLLGYAVVACRRSTGRHQRPAMAASGRVTTSSIIWMGPVLMLTGSVLLFKVVLSEGLNTLGADNYALFRTEQHTPELAWSFMFLGIGMGVLGTSGRIGKSHWWALAFLPVIAIPLVIGWRSGTIFPLAAFLVAWSRRQHVRIRFWHGAGFVGLLTLGSVVRQAREGGPSGFRLTGASLNPLDGLAELSATLRTVVVVREWDVVGHVPPVGWQTYWAPVERLIGHALGLNVVPATLDERNLSTAFLAQPELGAIGGSPTAEAYRAAGVLGVVVVMALLGAAIAFLDSQRSWSLWEYSVGMVGYVLLVWTRNNFTPVVAQIGLCIAIAIVANLFDRLRAGPLDEISKSGFQRPGRTPIRQPAA
ncbi:O-antigen polysaccharide polymerase Wzy [Micromonospora luteifusca]|uniref:O-antigen polysaccharide polymerase Wzy n=1 Tax=Micromonospora luteifusca TaxID=709860 RepID=UPI0033B27CA6